MVKENFLLPEGKNLAYYYAKVENTGDAPIQVGRGSLTLYTTGGEVLLEDISVDHILSYQVLQPGEAVYMYTSVWNKVFAEKPVESFTLTLEDAEYGEEYATLEAKAELVKKVDGTYLNYLYVTMTNPTDAPVFDLYVSAAMLDAEGTPLFADSAQLGSLGVEPGATVTQRLLVPEAVLEAMQTRGQVPAQFEATVRYGGRY